MANKVMFRGSEVRILNENEKEVLFSWGGNEYKFNKEDTTIDAYGNTWGATHDCTEWLVTDGKVSVVATKGYIENDASQLDGDWDADECIKAGDTIIIPTVHEALTDGKKLEAILSYRMEFEDYGWFQDILDGLSLYDIVEGLWVSHGGYYKVV